MSKEYFPKGDELRAVLHEVRHQILMRLSRTKGVCLENNTGFRDFQGDLDLFEITIDPNLPAILVSRSTFVRALKRARIKGWVYFSDWKGVDNVRRFKIDLTTKGKIAALGEWKRLQEVEDEGDEF